MPEAAAQSQLVGLTDSDLERVREEAEDDVFYFGRVICRHAQLSPRFHRPIMYVCAGQVEKLVPLLDDPDLQDSYAIRAIRRELSRHEVDWRTPEGQQRMRVLFRLVNLRLSRWFGKSSIRHSVRLWKITREPNLTCVLFTNVDDPKARDFCKQIRATVLSDWYQKVFPDRVPSDLKLLTESRILLNGRTVPDMEPNLMCLGFRTSPVAYHFDEIDFDDFVARENRSPTDLLEARDFLANLFGLYKPGHRFPIVRTLYGTRWDEEDDDAEIRKNPHCFTINIPGWVYDDPATEDLRSPGRSTCEEWISNEGMIERREEQLNETDGLGALAWRCNVLLDPTIAGGRLFPADLVDTQAWTPYRSALTERLIARNENPQVDLQRQKQKFMVRPIFDSKSNKMLAKFFAANPGQLFKVTACDQSFSEAQAADEWAVGTEGMDQFGHRYVIEVTTGKGVAQMLDEFVRHLADHKPYRWGQEKIGAAHVIELVTKMDRRYWPLRNLEMIPHNNVVKPLRIREFVAELLRMRRLWLDPADVATRQEMIAYRQRKADKDNRLDVLAMCEIMLRRIATKKDEQDETAEYRKKLERRNQIARERRVA